MMGPTNSAVVDGLIREHAGMRRILRLIGRQLDLLERRGGADPVLLANALHYMREFPRVVHHPKEELIFDCLTAARAPCQQELRQLRAQHRDIYELEDRLIERVLRLQPGDASQVAGVLEAGRHYLTVQNMHSVTEESIVFPAACAALTRDDWRQIENKSELIEDPLFGNSVAEKYQALYDYLMLESGAG